MDEKNTGLTLVSPDDILKADSTAQILDMVNLAAAKKDAIVVLKGGELECNALQELLDRYHRCSDEFTNKELVDIINATQTVRDKAVKNIAEKGDTPSVQYNQQINVAVSTTLNRESRDKIQEVIEAALALQSVSPVEVVEDLEEVVEEVPETVSEEEEESEEDVEKALSFIKESGVEINFQEEDVTQ